MSIAKHYKTGESLPEDICSKLLATRTFRAGSELLRQVDGIILEFISLPFCSTYIETSVIILMYTTGFRSVLQSFN